VSPPTSRHEHAAKAFARWVTQRYPAAGIAIAGSVASGTQRADSDLDLLVVDHGFRRGAQLSVRSEGVPTAVLCLPPRVSPAQAADWTFGAGPGRWLSGMIRSSRALTDPAGDLQRLREQALAIERARAERVSEIVEALRVDAAAAAADLAGAQGPGRAPASLRLVTATLEAWNLLDGAAIDSKTANRETFARIARADPALAELLRRTFPLSPATREPLLAAFTHVFGAAPD
jgi:hypothetical protein